MRKLYIKNLYEVLTCINPDLSLHKKAIKGYKTNLLNRLTSGAFFITVFSLFSFVSHSQNNTVTAVTITTPQTGVVTYGTSSSATYTVTLATDATSSANGSSDLTLDWSAPALPALLLHLTPLPLLPCLRIAHPRMSF